MPDKASTIELLNEARYFLPHLLALSTSSPFWQGRNTGLKSYRTTVFRRFPRSGIPDEFGSWSEYEEYLNTLVELHCIDDGKKVWWDLRPHPLFGTLEFRVCDVPTSPRVTIALAALAQALVVKLYRLRRSNLGFRVYSRAFVEENKWRAARYGIEGKLIDFGKRTEVPMRELTIELLEFVDDVVDELGSRKALESIHTILAEGTSADRQLRVYRETGDLRAVVRWLVDETRAGHGGRVKVGLLCGREYAFPPAFIDRVNTLGRPHLDHGGAREADRHDHRAVGLPGDRRPDFARGRVPPRLPEARRADRTYVISNPFWWTADDKFFNCAVAQARRRRAEDDRAAPEVLSARNRSDRGVAAQPRLPDRLGRPARLRRPPGDPQALLRRRLEHVYKVNNREELIARTTSPAPTA